MRPPLRHTMGPHLPGMDTTTHYAAAQLAEALAVLWQPVSDVLVAFMRATRNASGQR